MADRIAVVLFNLGGPDGPASVQPFLQNLFSDPAIIRSPAPVRWFLSRLISTTRKKSAIANYAKMGGGSPLLPETRKQADALDAELARRGLDAKSFIAMRYWKPFAPETVASVKAWGATRVVLLPLYPQFSTTTTGSSLKSWSEAGGASAATICCYPTAAKFIEAHARKIIGAWEAAGKPGNVRLLLSAHGLPEMIVKAGDPYQWQVEQTAAALRPLLPVRLGGRDLLPVARRPSCLDRPADRRVRSSAPQPTARPSSSRPSLSCPSTSKPWLNWTRTIATSLTPPARKPTSAPLPSASTPASSRPSPT